MRGIFIKGFLFSELAFSLNLMTFFSATSYATNRNDIPMTERVIAVAGMTLLVALLGLAIAAFRKATPKAKKIITVILGALVLSVSLVVFMKKPASRERYVFEKEDTSKLTTDELISRAKPNNPPAQGDYRQPSSWEIIEEVPIKPPPSRNDYLQQILKEIPDFERINNDPKFIKWLQGKDGIRAETRHQQLRRANDQMDAKTVISFFERYKAIETKEMASAQGQLREDLRQEGFVTVEENFFMRNFVLGAESGAEAEVVNSHLDDRYLFLKITGDEGNVVFCMSMPSRITPNTRGKVAFACPDGRQRSFLKGNLRYTFEVRKSPV